MSHEHLVKHGHAKHYKRTPEYNAYIAAKQRCTNPNTKHYADYGGRGIEFRFSSFEEFFKCLGARPDNHTLDRKDNDGHYEKGNVRWLLNKGQQRNRRNNRLVTYNGKTQTLAAWVDESGIKQSLLRHRLDANWCLDCVFNLPLHSSCRHRASGTKFDPKPKRGVEAHKSEGDSK